MNPILAKLVEDGIIIYTFTKKYKRELFLFTKLSYLSENERVINHKSTLYLRINLKVHKKQCGRLIIVCKEIFTI